SNEYLYLISLENSTPTTLAKVQLNSRTFSATGYGSFGYPVMVDSYPQDGVVDRIYMADSNGRLFKINTKDLLPPPALSTASVTLLATLGESVYAPLAVQASTTANSVKIFVAGGDNPDVVDTIGSYHLFAYEDTDP